MTDAEIINVAGGPTRMAALLGLSNKGSVQRVSNWRTRGIPPRIRLDHAQVFAQLQEGKPQCGDRPASASEGVRDAT